MLFAALPPINSIGSAFHRACFRCSVCRNILGQGYGSQDGKFFCSAHYRQAYQVPAGSAMPAAAPELSGSPSPALDLQQSAAARSKPGGSYIGGSPKPAAARYKGSGSHLVFRREASPQPADGAVSRDALFGVSLVELSRRAGINLHPGFANILGALSASQLRADGTRRPLDGTSAVQN